MLMCWLEADGSSRFVANGYKSVCTGEVRTVHCGNALVHLFIYFKMQNKLSFHFLEREGQSLLPSLTVPPILVHINTIFTHAGFVLEIGSSSWLKLFSLPYIPFALPYFFVLALAISPPE